MTRRRCEAEKRASPSAIFTAHQKEPIPEHKKRKPALVSLKKFQTAAQPGADPPSEQEVVEKKF